MNLVALDTPVPREDVKRWVAAPIGDLRAAIAGQAIKDLSPSEEVFISHPGRFTLVVWEDHGEARQVVILDGEIIPINE